VLFLFFPFACFFSFLAGAADRETRRFGLSLRAIKNNPLRGIRDRCGPSTTRPPDRNSIQWRAFYWPMPALPGRCFTQTHGAPGLSPRNVFPPFERSAPADLDGWCW